MTRPWTDLNRGSLPMPMFDRKLRAREGGGVSAYEVADP